MGNTNLSVAVVTQGRAYASKTLEWLFRSRPEVPVFVYVHKEDETAYRDLWGCFEIVVHEKGYGDILGIRSFVQNDQYAKGFCTLMLDDDILDLYFIDPANMDVRWSRSFKAILEEAKGHFDKGADAVVGFFQDHEEFYKKHLNPAFESPVVDTGIWEPVWHKIVGLAPSLYDKGVRYEESKTGSEDYYFSFMTRVKECVVEKLDCVCVAPLDATSHFSLEQSWLFWLQAYVNYGIVVESWSYFFGAHPWIKVFEWGYVNLKAVELYKKQGPIHTNQIDDFLQVVLDENLTGSEYLRNVGWRKRESYDDALMRQVCNFEWVRDFFGLSNSECFNESPIFRSRPHVIFDGIVYYGEDCVL